MLTSDTTLYCVTENKNTPQVKWSYVDLAGIKSNVPSTTDASTGVSSIQVITSEPGYYTCEVTENGGSSNTYTAVMTESNNYTGMYIYWLNNTSTKNRFNDSIISYDVNYVLFLTSTKC